MKRWAESLQPLGKANRNAQKAINDAAAKSLIEETAAHLEAHSIDETLAHLRATERALVASKPAL